MDVHCLQLHRPSLANLFILCGFSTLQIMARMLELCFMGQASLFTDDHNLQCNVAVKLVPGSPVSFPLG